MNDEDIIDAMVQVMIDRNDPAEESGARYLSQLLFEYDRMQRLWGEATKRVREQEADEGWLRH